MTVWSRPRIHLLRAEFSAHLQFTFTEEILTQAVIGHHWMYNAQFADIFSISQTAPGPSILIVTPSWVTARDSRSGEHRRHSSEVSSPASR